MRRKSDYPEPDVFGRIPSYALPTRHVIGRTGHMMKAIHLATVTKAVS